MFRKLGKNLQSFTKVAANVGSDVAKGFHPASPRGPVCFNVRKKWAWLTYIGPF